MNPTALDFTTLNPEPPELGRLCLREPGGQQGRGGPVGSLRRLRGLVFAFGKGLPGGILAPNLNPKLSTLNPKL